MAYKSIPIVEASDAQIRSFALMMGAEIEASDTPTLVMSKLLTIHTEPNILIPTDAPAPVQAAVRAEDIQPVRPVAAQIGGRGAEDPRVIIQIANSERDGVITSQDVAVGVNGFIWQLRRGVKLDIPYRVYLNLMDAERKVITMDPETGDLQETTAPAYPFQVFGLPSAAEVVAWHEMIDGLEVA